MGTLVQDIRHGIRQLYRQPGSSAIAVLTLALGIGVCTAVLSVIDATMLRPLPYPDPEQLVTIGVEVVRPDGQVSRPTASMEDMRIWQAADDVLSSAAGWGSAFRGRIADGPQPERLQVAHFTEDYLSMHGVRPILGRDFTRADTEHGAPLVALLGYGHWKSRFGGRQNVVGETIRLDADIATIVGVLPAWFNATTPVATPLQVRPDWFSRRGTGRVNVYGRLRRGVTIEQARERLSARMTAATPADGRVQQVRARVESRLEAALKSYRTTVNVLAGAVALILLIAVVNVSGLLLARGAARQSEFAVRASLGARRVRLIRQLLTESAVLAVPATAIGVLLAWLTLDIIVANVPLSMPTNSPVTVNVTVLAITVALLLPTTLFFGLVPALRLSRVRLNSVIARGSRQVGSTLSRRGSQLLIAVEVALAVVLVAGAGLMIRSFMRLSAVDLGFNTDRLVTMQVLPLERNPAAHREFYWSLVNRLRTAPGVSAVGVVDNFPLRSGYTVTNLRAGDKWTGTSIFDATPGYFEALGARVVHGQLPSDAQYTSGFRWVVINESAARSFFPDGAAIGRELVRIGSDSRPWTVIAVVADLKHGGPLARSLNTESQVFFPLDPTESDITTAMTVVVRTSSDVPGLADQLRQAAQAIGPRVLVERIRNASELFGETVITPRRRLVLLGLLGGLGLTLALVGVFGMTAYTVTRRTAEIGVRLAFGARPGQVVAMMVRDSALPIVIGTAMGVGGAVLATRTIESFLFETPPRDPITLATVAAILALTGCLAAFGPALRAARLDPALTLRTE